MLHYLAFRNARERKITGLGAPGADSYYDGTNQGSQELFGTYPGSFCCQDQQNLQFFESFGYSLTSVAFWGGGGWLSAYVHDVTWSRRDSFCGGQYEEPAQPEEFPTMPVKMQIRQLPKPSEDLSFAKFNFDEEDPV